MLFSAPEFIFAFLPIVFVGYYLSVRVAGKSVSGAFLALASLVFYAWWKPIYLPLIVVSILVNYGVGSRLIEQTRNKRGWLIFGVVFNLGLLGYFKYSWFAVETVAEVVGSSFRMEPLLLPLAISFFTFQQIAFLVDAYKGEVERVSLPNYTLFVSFFPQLIAGPIVHHREMMPQFASEKRYWPTWLNVEQGLRIFLIGLAKKLIIADTLARYADGGWAHASELTFYAAWGTTLCYTFQLYFDFSGYSDMALGAARFFGIHLPYNFNSPYKAQSIQDFWKRWHMTLSRWLKDYLYIPLGGNRRGKLLTYRNLFITFLLGGIWHGAGWTFMIWGAMHGVGCMIHRWWSRFGIRIPGFVAWLMTFIFVHIGWVFFRAPSVTDAWVMIKRLIHVKGAYEGVDFAASFQTLLHWQWISLVDEAPVYAPIHMLPYLIVVGGIAFLARSSIRIALESPMRTPLRSAIWYGLLGLVCVLASVKAAESPFLYFNF